MHSHRAGGVKSEQAGTSEHEKHEAEDNEDQEASGDEEATQQEATTKKNNALMLPTSRHAWKNAKVCATFDVYKDGVDCVVESNRQQLLWGNPWSKWQAGT